MTRSCLTVLIILAALWLALAAAFALGFAAGAAASHRPAVQADLPFPPGRMTTEPLAAAAGHARLASGPDRYPDRSVAAPSARQESAATVPTIADARAWALRRLGARQAACLFAFVQRESRWNPLAVNRRSGAAGLFQALPPEKQAKYGADYLTSPLTQMRFGLAYIASRYGTPCRALDHALTVGWF